MFTAWDDVLLILAVFRITWLLAREAGPGHICERLRVRLGVEYDVNSEPYATGFWSELVLCPWCLSLWVAAVYIGVALLLPLHVLSLLLAASAVTVLLSLLFAENHG